VSVAVTKKSKKTAKKKVSTVRKKTVTKARPELTKTQEARVWLRETVKEKVGDSAFVRNKDTVQNLARVFLFIESTAKEKKYIISEKEIISSIKRYVRIVNAVKFKDINLSFEAMKLAIQADRDGYLGPTLSSRLKRDYTADVILHALEMAYSDSRNKVEFKTILESQLMTKSRKTKRSSEGSKSKVASSVLRRSGVENFSRSYKALDPIITSTIGIPQRKDFKVLMGLKNVVDKITVRDVGSSKDYDFEIIFNTIDKATSTKGPKQRVAVIDISKRSIRGISKIKGVEEVLLYGTLSDFKKLKDAKNYKRVIRDDNTAYFKV
jgi:hypothetical protein